MWRTFKDKTTGKVTEKNCCPACLVPFDMVRHKRRKVPLAVPQLSGYCVPCDRSFAHAEKPLPEKKNLWNK